MVKGHLTGCSLHGYSHVSFLTSQLFVFNFFLFHTISPSTPSFLGEETPLFIIDEQRNERRRDSSVYYR